MKGLRHYILPALWVVVIYVFSSSGFSGRRTFEFLKWLTELAGLSLTVHQIMDLNFLVRKAAHVGTYAILAVLWFRAFKKGSGLPHSTSFVLSLFLAAVVASLDEYHQSLVMDRSSRVSDVLIDTFGAVAALFVMSVWMLKRRRKFGRRLGLNC